MTAGRSGTASAVSAGSRSTIPRPSGTSASGWPASASPRARCGSSRPTSPATRWPSGCSRPDWTRPGAACSCSKGWPSTWRRPCWKPSSASSARSPGGQPAGHQRLAVRSGPGQVPVPRHGGVPGRAGQVHAGSRRGRTPAGPHRLAGHDRRRARRPRKPPPAARLRSAGLLTARAADVRPARTSPPHPCRRPWPAAPPPRPAVTVSSPVTDAGRAHDRVRQRGRAPHPAPRHGLRRRGPGRRGLAGVPGMSRTACGSSPTSRSRSRNSWPGPYRTNLDGMRRWGYITIDAAARKIRHGRPGPGAVLRATPVACGPARSGLTLPGLVEQRWRDRYGARHEGLRRALAAVTGQLDPGLPDILPILGQALFSRGPDPVLPPRPQEPDVTTLPLSALLSACCWPSPWSTRPNRLSLAVGANMLRVLGSGRTRLRDLPHLTGISKEAVTWAMGVLLRARLAVQEPDPARHPRQGGPPHPCGRARAAALPRAPGHDRGPLGAAPRPRRRRRPAPVRRSACSPSAPMASRRPCSRPWSPTRTTGAPAARRPRRSRTTR